MALLPVVVEAVHPNILFANSAWRAAGNNMLRDLFSVPSVAGTMAFMSAH
jgi:hypothetical protein